MESSSGLHPNWRALATCKIQFKKFVKAADDDKDFVKKYEESDDVNDTEKGQEIKDFYDDVITDEELSRKKLKTETNLKVETVETVELSDDDEIEVIDPEANKKLLVAIQNEDLAGIKQLRNCSFNDKDEFGWTVLEIAAVTGNSDILEYLIERGATAVTDENRLRNILVKKNLTDIIDILWNKSDEVDDITDDEVVMVTCDHCGELFDEDLETEHKASIAHQLSLDNDEARVRNPGFLISEGNIGFKMMKRCGWDGVSGLGGEGAGKLFPVKTVFKHDRRGLDVGDKKLMRITHFGPGDATSVENRRKRKQNFNVKTVKMKKMVKRGNKQFSANVSQEQSIREDIGDL